MDKKTDLANEAAWILRVAAEDDSGSISVGGFATKNSLLETHGKALERDAFAKVIQLQRRSRGLSVEQLAENADVDIVEVIEIENGRFDVPETRTVFNLAAALQLPAKRLLQLSGLTQAKDDPELRQAALRFAARSGSVEKLTKEEQEALEELVKIMAEQ
jgi:transcriptional regulator with XRE-family HTH domain